ncbi:MAG: Hpt domain-containing protein [Nitrosomonadales bacterium]|nr:Hpt domain-containing protein [Nitrosomonadales bacterium]
MASSPQSNLVPLLAIKPSLDATLATVSADLEGYFNAPASANGLLLKALAELHRVRGVLRMFGLEGLAVFSGELENLLQELADGALPFTPVQGEVVGRALKALTRYLDSLANGADNAALKLFNRYQELRQARGLEQSAESDLFFPALNIELPAELLESVPPEGANELIRGERGKYQHALLKWLRNDQPAAALETMRSAVRQVLDYAPQDNQRAFWWVSSALLDCLLHDGLPPELNAKRLLGRMDLQMKSLFEGTASEVKEVLSEMLYLIARSQPVSETVEAIKQAYALDVYLPKANTMPEEQTGQVLAEMRVAFRQVESSWEKFAAEGDLAAGGVFAEQIAKLSGLSQQLGQDTLHYLCEQIQSIVDEAEIDGIQRIAMDMAMALLLLQNGIDHYANLDHGYQEQAEIVIKRIRATLRSEAGDSDELDELVTMQSQTEERSALAPLADEMLSNLQLVEQGLNTFFAEPNKHDELLPLDRLLAQVRGGLHLLSLPRALRVLDALREALSRLVRERSAPQEAEMQALAFASSALQSVAQNLANGHKHEGHLTDAAMEELKGLKKPVATPAATERKASSAPINELLEIFLEEAREVLETISANLDISHQHPDSPEPLVTVRRGFHTLKGSGRMVGLKELGDVAWAIERMMNQWLQEGKAATPGLLAFIARAEAAFNYWVGELAVHGDTEIDAAELVSLANQVEAGLDPDAVLNAPAKVAVPEVVASPVEAPAPVQAAEPAVPTEVKIGPVTLSATMFGIATEEAAQHIAALWRQLEALRVSVPSVIHFDFMRAAHTLAGINRTIGFTSISDLSYALEQWLQARIDLPLTLSDAQLALLERCVGALDEMTQAVSGKQTPEDRADVVEALQADQVQALPAVAVEEPAAPVATSPEAKQEVEAAPVAEAPPLIEQEIAAALADHVAPDQIVLEVRDDVDEQLLPVFLEESNDLFPQIGNGLRAWREQPDSEQFARNLRRTLHTIKGGARMAGAMRIGELTHKMEDRVMSDEAHGGQTAAFWDELEDYFDYLGVLLEQLRSGEYKNPLQEVAGEKGEAEETQAAGVQQPLLEIGAERAALTNMLRVRSDIVDRLVNEAGEIGVTRSHIEAELRTFKNGLLELTESVNRLRKQLREIEIQAESQMQARVSLSEDTAEKFDPLEFDRFTRFQELTRFMNESVHDVQTVQQTLLKNLDETAGALTAQAHMNRELQEGLMSIRMVPFASISERLYRIVRQTGKELGKKANLELSGTELELDRSMLEKMTAPFEHLLRNSMVHGLESPEARDLGGKPPLGDIRLSLRQESNEVVFEFSDDGAGLDMARLRRKGLELGLVQPGEQVADDQIIQLIFASGLSTAETVTEVAGRGVGMDVVRSEVIALGGQISVTTEPGKGTRFTIHLPLTLAVMQSVMVHSGDDLYAIPSTMVEQVQQHRTGALEAIYAQRSVEWMGRTYPLHYLPHLLGDYDRVPEVRPHTPILLLRSGDLRIALHVDSMAGKQEVVVKNIGPQLARMQGIAGATLLGNGQIALILNPPQLAQRNLTIRKVVKPVVVEPQKLQPIVMVVDDSLTVRKITTRFLMRAGYQVITAKDGVDALEQLAAGAMPNVMLLDIEMPRMDGFELTKQLRRDAKTRELPIIMITSRTADKHRDHAMQLGVNHYLGKPFQEEDLLVHIANYTTAAVAA